MDGVLALTTGTLFWWAAVTMMASTTCASDAKPPLYHDYCVIGAGPSGLQLGYFLKKAGRDYVIFERSNTAGNFYTTYPRHRKLISINKRHTGTLNKESAFRHDWNSLISDDESLLFKHYSKDLFPSADVLVDYLNDFKMKHQLNVQFDTEVSNIRPVRNESVQERRVYLLDDQLKNTYTCSTVIAATGMWKPNIPEGVEPATGYEDISVNPEDYENKSVLILGKGNSAFETADAVSGHAQFVHIMTRSVSIPNAYDTHYVGDLRAVNNNLLDLYLLKSLDGVLYMDYEDRYLEQRGGKFYISKKVDSAGSPEFDNNPYRRGYDVAIRCLGFTFDTSIFNDTDLTRPSGKAKKYPAISNEYESVDYPGVFVAGTASHSLDFRRSAGGFIHGFRYTAKALHHLLEWRYESVSWPSKTIPTSQLINTIIKRVNEGSGFYQMFAVLGDVAIINRDTDTVTYLEEFPISLLHELPRKAGHNATEVIVVYLDYGPPGVDKYDLFDGTAKTAHLSYFLHPIINYYKRLPTARDFRYKDEHDPLPRPDSMHQIVEDFHISFEAWVQHILPLRRWLEHIFGKDLKAYYAGNCMEMALTHSDMPPSCHETYIQGHGLTGTPELLAAGQQQLLPISVLS